MRFVQDESLQEQISHGAHHTHIDAAFRREWTSKNVEREETYMFELSGV